MSTIDIAFLGRGRRRRQAPQWHIPELKADVRAGGDGPVAIDVAAVVDPVHADRVDEQAGSQPAQAQSFTVIGIEWDGLEVGRLHECFELRRPEALLLAVALAGESDHRAAEPGLVANVRS